MQFSKSMESYLFDHGQDGLNQQKFLKQELSDWKGHEKVKRTRTDWIHCGDRHSTSSHVAHFAFEDGIEAHHHDGQF